MGYKLTNLARLPLQEEIEIYIFSIGDDLWEGGLDEIVRKNFDQIAETIGENAIIVKGLNEEFHGDVVRAYLGKSFQELQNELPALLVTDSHPENLTDGSPEWCMEEAIAGHGLLAKGAPIHV